MSNSFGILRENVITFHSGLQIRWSWTLWKAYSEDYPFKLKTISNTTWWKWCDKCFSHVSIWKARFEHRDINKAINVTSLLIVQHYLYLRSNNEHNIILLRLNIFIMPLFFNITLWGFANTSFISFLSIILLELVPWDSSSYMINFQLVILKTPKSIW